MKLSEIKPFIRFARYEKFPATAYYKAVQGLDCRLFYTMSGKGIYIVEGKEYTLAHGDLLFINSTVPYSRANSSEPVSYLTVNFDFSFHHSNQAVPMVPAHSEYMLSRHLVEHVEFEDFPQFNHHAVIRGAFFAENLLMRLEHEYRTKKNFYELCSSNILSEILMLMARRINAEQNIPAKNVEKLDKILKFIHDHFNEPLSNEFLGNTFGFHPYHLNTLVKNYTGTSLHQYILNIRIEKAMTLLETSRYTIEEISNRVGFPNPAYFSRYFKKLTKLSPAEYRKFNSF